MGMRVALGQIDTTVGDLEGNVERMVSAAAAATASGADLICFPELAVTGYPPEDLVLRWEFVEDNLEAVADLARRTSDGCAVLTGFVDRSGPDLLNAAGLLHGGRVVARYHKVKLPNYGVFDEKRYFVPGHASCALRLGRLVAGDLGVRGHLGARRALRRLREAGRQGHPEHQRLPLPPRQVVRAPRDGRARARETGAWIVYVNAVGGQDELVFDGGSMVVAPDGDLAWRASIFDEDLLVVDLDVPKAPTTLTPDVPGLSTAPRPAIDPSRPPWPEGPRA